MNESGKKPVIKSMVKIEKSLVKAIKMWRTYNLYKRNPWLRYLPFHQIQYDWIITLWANQESHIKLLFKVHNTLKKMLMQNEQY